MVINPSVPMALFENNNAPQQIQTDKPNTLNNGNNAATYFFSVCGRTALHKVLNRLQKHFAV
jgi:hypothetical protein